jgi:hypothetical protein
MDQDSKIQTQFRLVVGMEANESLEAAVQLVNDGFLAGSVSKSDLATYFFKNASRFLKPAELVRIRNEFFDERKALEDLIRKSEESGGLPEELKKLLKDQYRSSVEDK